MRLKMLSLTIISALLLAQAACRPQEQPGSPVALAQHPPPADARSRLDPPSDRELKDYQYMDQSLRTVATQLLNVSGPEDMVGVKSDRVEPKMGLLIRKPERRIPPREPTTEAGEKPETTTADPIRRSTNSKYNFFQASHPGQAMALTEEELERELASTRVTSTLKPKPTTSGGLSTWILLNPPSTTSKSTEIGKKPDANKPEAQKKPEGQTKNSQKNSEKIEENLLKMATAVKTEVPTAKPEVKVTESAQKSTTLKVTSPKKPPTTAKPPTSSTPTATTPRSEPRSTSPGTPQFSSTTEGTAKSASVMKKPPPTIRTTPRPKPKTTTLKPTTVVSKTTTIKVVKPNQPRPSKPPRKVTTPKPEVKSPANVTSKIEKVTFKPVHMITTPRSHVESVPKPTFSTKIQASIQTEEKSASSQFAEKSVEKSAEKSVQNSAKPTNVLKVHLKKPVDTPTKIEIAPIKVNPPILTIEKIGAGAEPAKTASLEPLDLENSQIDLKFDFSPETTTKAATEPSTTTKKPKSKRKKHKTRRRKPATTAAPMTSVAASTEVTTTKKIRKSSTTAAPDTSIQESKLAPETNSTKLKKKQAAKPLSAQIYSFLSREVMPSVGVMSLVGLGLGLASYFLYPFGGAIARRNYEVEPNYKYNPEEYGGNYGQSEEEVLKKVFQGMTPTEAADKNYYRYQNFGDYTTRRADLRFQTASVPVYRPDNTPLPYEPKYEDKFNSKYNKNTEFKYPPDVPTTPTYFDRSKPDFTQINVDRQFVVGSIPKGYGNEDKQVKITTEAVQTDFEKQIAQNLQFVGSPGGAPEFAQPDAQALRADAYEEIEITPTAVAVEHGPRALRFDEQAEPKVSQTEQSASPSEAGSLESALKVVAALKNRRKRESVIQLIPSRAEVEKEEHEFETEEPLSNEILDIIDSALPGDGSKSEVDVKINEIEPAKEVTTQKPREDLTTSGTTTSSKPKEVEVEEATTTTASMTTTTKEPEKSIDIEPDVETFPTTAKPEEGGSGIVNFLRKVAEFKFRLGLTVLKHASESFARYLGHVQKRMNGEE